MKAEDMPVDAAGNRADLIMDSDSTIKRMNLGRLYEQAFNAASYNVARQVREMVKEGTDAEIEKAFEYLTGYYKLASPKMYQAIFDSGTHKKGRMRDHVEDVIANGVYLWLPTDNPVEHSDSLRAIREHYPPIIGPVTYRGASGNQCETVESVMIGSMYIVLLEKMGNSWASVSSSKLQNFGIPAKLTNADRHSTPIRNQPVRIAGESENRLFAATIGGDATADLMDQSNNPEVHGNILENILSAQVPTAIDTVVNRKKHPRGAGRPLQIVNHWLECSGARWVEGTDGENYDGD